MIRPCQPVKISHDKTTRMIIMITHMTTIHITTMMMVWAAPCRISS